MVKAVIKSILEKYQINPQEFFRLEEIGGHKQYHLEGNALEHTMLVYYAACNMFPSNWEMQRVALLHDIGKIYTSIKKGENDWKYPDHSTCGSFRGVLSKFIPLDDPHFVDYQWLIKNHIKPLYWKHTGIKVDTTSFEKANLDSKLANLDNLRKLAICDLKGSKSIDGNDELITYLSNLTL